MKWEVRDLLIYAIYILLFFLSVRQVSSGYDFSFFLLILCLQVLQSEPLLMKIQRSSLEICLILFRLLQSSSSTSSVTRVQVCEIDLIHCILHSLYDEIALDARHLIQFYFLVIPFSKNSCDWQDSLL